MSGMLINLFFIMLASSFAEIFSLNDVGDLTYDYQCLNGKTKTIKNIFENNDELSKKIIEAKNNETK